MRFGVPELGEGGMLSVVKLPVQPTIGFRSGIEWVVIQSVLEEACDPAQEVTLARKQVLPARPGMASRVEFAPAIVVQGPDGPVVESSHCGKPVKLFRESVNGLPTHTMFVEVLMVPGIGGPEPMLMNTPLDTVQQPVAPPFTTQV